MDALPPTPRPKVADYEVISQEVDEIPSAARVTLRLAISGPVDEEMIRTLLVERCENLRTQSVPGLKYHSRPTKLQVIVYPSKAHAESGMEQYLGKLWFSDGDAAPDITIDREAVAATQVLPESRHGLTEDQRRTIYVALDDASNRAARETLEKNESADWGGKLLTRYRKQVLERVGISEDIADDIAEEGGRKNWPGAPN